jgi:hypothetical protein
MNVVYELGIREVKPLSVVSYQFSVVSCQLSVVSVYFPKIGLRRISGKPKETSLMKLWIAPNSRGGGGSLRTEN